MNRKTILIAAAVSAAFVVSSKAATINEIRPDNPGSDINEYFELAGTPGESLNDLTYVVIGDGVGGSGVIEVAVSLAGQSIPADGYFLAAEDTHTLNPAQIDLSLSGAGNGLNFENDDRYTHLLVSGFTGAAAQDLDTNDDGILDSTPWASIIDSVAFLGDGSDLVYSGTQVGPDPVKGTPWHLYRLPNGSGPWLFDSFDNGSTTGNVDLANYPTDTPGVANPEPASLSLVALAAVPMVRRRRA